MNKSIAKEQRMILPGVWRQVREFCSKAGGEFFHKRGARIAALGVSLILPVLLLSFNFMPEAPGLQEGQISLRDHKSPRTVKYVDPVETKVLRKDAARNVPKAYSADPSVALGAQSKIEETLGTAAEVAEGEGLTEKSARRTAMESRIVLNLSSASLDTLTTTEASMLRHLEREAKQILREAMERPIRDDVPQDLVAAQGFVKERVKKLSLHPALEKLLLEICLKVLKPNHRYDSKKTEDLRKKAVEAVKPAYKTIRSGEIIVKAGEKVTGQHLAALTAAGLRRTHVDLLTGSVIFLVVGFLVGLLAFFLKHHSPAAYQNDGLLLTGGAILGGAILLFKLASASMHPWIVGMGIVSIVTLTSAILVETSVALVMACAVAILIGIAANNEPGILAAMLAIGLVSTLPVPQLTKRLPALIKSGLLIGLANVLILVVGGKVIGISPEWGVGVPRIIIFAFAAGPVAAMSAFGLILALERPLGITTPFLLVELSNPNEALLKRLLVTAPGTFHSSALVADLACSAAEAVGADPLLTRAGAYYHDIGKIKRPTFFVENQFYGHNPHDKMSPSLSALVLAAHVKDGVEMAREQKLPQPIVNIIQQHHGTAIMHFFFEKAKRVNNEPVEEANFRYLGPKPRSKEAALIMLADTVEGGVRSLRNPTITHIRDAVRQLIEERVSDGQLDECDLTYRDIAKIENIFSGNLVGVFHHRLQYPTLGDLEGGRDAGNRKERATEKG